MKPSCRFAKICTALIIFYLTLFSIKCYASIDASAVINNIVQGDKQSVLSGKIDSLTIIRGKAEFHLGAGDVTLYDFGSGKISALTFKGNGRFVYNPPNDVERGQLRKFTKQDSLDDVIQKAVLFFTAEIDRLPDTTGFVRNAVDKGSWGMLADAEKEAFDHLRMYMPNSLIGDLLAAGQGTYFYADINVQNTGELIFCEDPLSDDMYRLYLPVAGKGIIKYDVLGGYSPQSDLVSQRGVLAIDVSHYEISSAIEGNGRMTVECRIDFLPLRDGRQFIYFRWHPDNKIISAGNSKGDSLFIVNTKDEPGFGLILKDPLAVGESSNVKIMYECKALKQQKEWQCLYLDNTGLWFPANIIPDKAVFENHFEFPKDMRLIIGGHFETSIGEKKQNIVSYTSENQIPEMSFCMGKFDTLVVATENGGAVKTFLPEDFNPGRITINISERTNYDKLIEALLNIASTGTWIENYASEVRKSAMIDTRLFGTLSVDTIVTTLLPYYDQQGSEGLVYHYRSESSGPFLHFDEATRIAREMAGQWWGTNVMIENYHDEWIINGFTEFSAILPLLLLKESTAGESLLINWQDEIISNNDKAGPLSLGHRLGLPIADTCEPVDILKAAYIFQMLKNLMHDYKRFSDQPFLDLCRQLPAEFKSKSISTAGLKGILDQRLGYDMSWFIDEWVNSTEIPQYTVHSSFDPTSDGKYSIGCHVSQEGVPSDFKMAIPIEVTFKGSPSIFQLVWINQKETNLQLGVNSLKPTGIKFNIGQAVLCKIIYD